MRCSSRGQAMRRISRAKSPCSLGDDSVCREVLEEDASVRQYETMAKVFFAQLRSRLDQAPASETFFFAGFLQLNPIAQFPRDPGAEGSHHLKPLGAQPAKPPFTILGGRFHRGLLWLVSSGVMHMISSMVEPLPVLGKGGLRIVCPYCRQTSLKRLPSIRLIIHELPRSQPLDASVPQPQRYLARERS